MRTDDEQQNSVKTYLYCASTSSCGGTNATIQEYRQHGKAQQEEPTKTITTKTIANTTGSQPPLGTTQINKNYETFEGGVMLMEHGTK